jgi:branched-chain amino acid transport system ATP-binding protein
VTALLEADGLGIAFGGVKAVDDVSFRAEAGQILAIIGPNGAGKTTLFNMVSGLYLPKSGRVRLAGEDVTGLEPHLLARRGLSRTFQNLQIFFRMTAAENVMVGRHLHEARGLLAHLFAWPSVGRQNRETRAAALALLARVGLAGEADVPAGSLSYGALKRLEIARALATEPRVLLLDEPAAGCNPVETEEIDRVIQEIARQGIAVVLVEHDMKLVMKISDRILVLDHGRPLAEGVPAEVRVHPEVIRAYLGGHGAREAAGARG